MRYAFDRDARTVRLWWYLSGVCALVLCMALAGMPALADDGKPSTAQQVSAVLKLLTSRAERPKLSQPGVLELQFLSVNAADCTLIRLDGHSALIDSGCLPEAERVLHRLAELGIDRLDFVFATHPHADHIGGFIEILDRIPVEGFYMPASFSDYHDAVTGYLDATIERKQIQVHLLRDGDSLAFGNAALAFYQWNLPEACVNDNSMVTTIHYGERKALLFADVEGDGQVALSDRWGAALRADIFKFPHHGLAPYTSRLHQAVDPSLVIVTNGKQKTAPMLKPVKRRRLPCLYTTDGIVVCTTDGRSPWTVYQEPWVDWPDPTTTSIPKQ